MDLTTLDPDAVRANLQRAHATLLGVLGEPVTLFRAPNGTVSPTVLAEAAALGYTVVGWRLDGHDWTRPGADYVARRVVRLAEPGDIVGLCGNDACLDTPNAVAVIAQDLAERGYALVTVSDLLAAGSPR